MPFLLMLKVFVQQARSEVVVAFQEQTTLSSTPPPPSPSNLISAMGFRAHHDICLQIIPSATLRWI